MVAPQEPGRPGSARNGPSRRKWEAAVSALLAEPTVEQAAGKAGVGYRTLKTWLALPEFQDRYRQARQAVLDRTVAGLLRLMEKTLKTLEQNLDSDGPTSNRAAALALAHAFKGIELLDLAQEVAELKAEMEKLKDEHRDTRPGSAEPEDGAAAAGPEAEPGTLPLAAGPGPDPGGCRDEPRSLAG